MVNSRSKGARGEREFAAKLRELGYPEARRGQQFSGGPDSPDVACGIPGTHPEVKRTERLQLWKAMDQAKQEAGPGEVPYVAYRCNGRPWLITVELDRLLDLSEKLDRRNRPNHCPDCGIPIGDGIPCGESE